MELTGAQNWVVEWLGCVGRVINRIFRSHSFFGDATRSETCYPIRFDRFRRVDVLPEHPAYVGVINERPDSLSNHNHPFHPGCQRSHKFQMISGETTCWSTRFLQALFKFRPFRPRRRVVHAGVER